MMILVLRTAGGLFPSEHAVSDSVAENFLDVVRACAMDPEMSDLVEVHTESWEGFEMARGSEPKCTPGSVLLVRVRMLASVRAIPMVRQRDAS